ncbi:hypothetical protein CJF32_00010555 [Rutstroemia sp. NJR-2017a WRK4]|nr:hypothetical protein CJF32_00010555 [Rutstroemia sp. NJR-2017a WRK4]
MNGIGNPIKRNPDVTPITLPNTSALLVGVVVISSQTVYLQEPNYFPKTTYGIPAITPSLIASTFPNSTTASTSTSPSPTPAPTTSSVCLQPLVVLGTSIPVASLTTGQFVAVTVICGHRIYVQEPNYLPSKTHFGMSATTVSKRVVAYTTPTTS